MAEEKKKNMQKSVRKGFSPLTAMKRIWYKIGGAFDPLNTNGAFKISWESPFALSATQIFN
jgi:hypothetical protein